MPALVETMFSGESHVPWWVGLQNEGKATVVEGLLTAKDALVAAELDWQVTTRELYTVVPDSTRFIAIDDHKATVRSIDDKPLGVVGSRYIPVQNEQLFSFLDAIVESNEAHYLTAGSLKGGRVVWMLLKMAADTFTIGGDVFEDYLMATTAHDGSGAVKVKPCRTRVVCWNTFSMAMSETASTFSARHTSSVTERVHEAREAMDLASRWFTAFDEEIMQLLDTQVESDQFKAIIEANFPLVDDKGQDLPEGRMRTIRQDARAEIADLYQDQYIGTGWGVLNAFNTYEQWSKTAKGGSRAERQANALLQGNSGFPLTASVRASLIAA